MYRIITFITLLLISFSSIAHTNYCPRYKNGNLIISYCTGFKAYEFTNNVETLSTLANLLLDNYNLDTVYPIRINLSHTQIDSSYSTISIDSVDLSYYRDPLLYPKGKIEDVQTGIYIYQKANQFKSSTLLKLLDYAVNNQKRIINNQKLNQFKTIFGTENRLTIAKETIDEIINSYNQKVNELVNVKIHRKPDSSLKKHELSYYYQNDTYYFYFNEENWKSERSIFTTKTLKQIVDISVNNPSVDINRYYLVFENDSIFYRCSKNAMHTIKRIVAPNQFNHNPIINKATFYNRRNKSIAFSYDQFTGGHIDYSNKLLFFTEIDSVIANYGSLEEIFIHKINHTKITDSVQLKLYEEKTAFQTDRENQSNEKRILFTLLIVSLSITMYLIVKNRLK